LRAKIKKIRVLHKLFRGFIEHFVKDLEL
jgi:hypothetical protein